MPSFIYLGGISGAGKTSAGKEIASKLGFVEYVSSGEIKRPLAREIFGKGLSVLNQEETYTINKLFLENLVKKDFSKRLVLIDSHYTYPPPDKDFVKILPPDCTSIFDLFVLLYSPPEIIVDRRIKRGRDRDSISVQFTSKELLEERIEAQRLSKNYEIPLELFNTNVSFNFVVDKLRSILFKYF